MSFTNVYTNNNSSGNLYFGATIKATKLDAQGQPLAGASFVLIDSQGREAYSALSDEDGLVLFTCVASGTYTLKEKSASQGYLASTESYELDVNGSRVTMDSSVYSAQTFVNKREAELNR